MTNLESRLQALTIEDALKQTAEDGDKWGLSLRELYRLAMNFYKDKSGKAVHLSYEDNLKLIAFTQQAAHGPIDLSTAQPLGVLDVIGRDRRMAWQQLGTISKAQSMEGFIDLLDRLCPLFKPYVEAIKKDKEEKYRLALEEEKRVKEQQEHERIRNEEQKKMEELKTREELQKRHLQDILNQQTFHQFKAYAEKQYPGNPEQQAILIRQLQNEHYHQYMQQLHAQVVHDNGNIEEWSPSSTNQQSDADNNKPDDCQSSDNPNGSLSPAADNADCNSDDGSSEFPTVVQANMWTRQDIGQFKKEVSAGKGDGVIRIGHGDTLTVRVPTHDGGNCLFWEFATDSYDVGFGVYFEWGKSATTEVTVHISESDDDDEGLEDEDAEVPSTDDLESGTGRSETPPNQRTRPFVTSIVPIYRRECQNEVYVGSHTYPGEGVYLLKFDNSYSLWRSKLLYYRVYYTRNI